LWLMVVGLCARGVVSGSCRVRRGIWAMMMWIGRCGRVRSTRPVTGQPLGGGLPSPANDLVHAAASEPRCLRDPRERPACCDRFLDEPVALATLGLSSR
jgi:hypothetical protein